jgi:hypothetical protein
VNYPSIRIEGAILSPDILERIEDAPGQKPRDFGLDPSAKVKDEIARAWADAQDYWRIFQRKLETLKPDSPATTETRQQWVVPLLGLLGYQLDYQARGVELNGKTYSISHRATNRAQSPVQIVGYREPAGLDRKPERANVRMSAHAVVQEYVNLTDQLYGIVTNGRVLRLLRDSSRLIKLSYLEFDLDRIFTDGLFADFAILYRLLHASRLPITSETASESWIERYHQDSLDSGARIREGLSRAVEQAIRDFGSGFLAANPTLRNSAIEGKLSAEDYYKHLLRLIYRLLFLMVIEERDLVFPPKANASQRDIYSRYYSLRRLRLLSERRYLADHRKHDLWMALLATFRLFEANGPGEKLGLAPLAGDLFGRHAIMPLTTCVLGNDVLLGCLRSLSLYEHPENRQLIRVNYAALNVEEFGSVYEGLLEYQPTFILEGGRVEFDLRAGDERAATGSHYTPDDLVQPLVKHSLDHLIAGRLKAADREVALLDLRVADIACGSGHILLAAARRIATDLAIVRTGEEQPTPSAYRAALRDVIRTCIYGVDLNPLAVELCKVALWLEAHNPGLPLNFLDHHIKCGNAIVGFAHREDVDEGVPEEAFVTLSGDDKEIAAKWRKDNKTQRESHRAGQRTLPPDIQQQLDAILVQWKRLSALPERTPSEIEKKKFEFTEFAKRRDAWTLNQIAAIPIAQFYIPKTLENSRKLIADGEFRRYWTGAQAPQGQAVAMAWDTALRRCFFHWFLEFPEISARGGFDCILGNPPYLGGQALSGTHGHSFCGYVKWAYVPAGLSDLVVYFVRRIFELLKPGGFAAFITTNSIKDGDIRKDGLEQVLAQGGAINMAVRGIKWPGRANLVVSLVAIHKGVWDGARMLDGQKVSVISPYFEDSTDIGPPSGLQENNEKIFMGTIWLGEGFLLSRKDIEIMGVERSPGVRPLLNGQEVNSSPDQTPQRWIINLENYDDLESAELAEPVLVERLRELVLPERLAQKNQGAKEKWWRYYRYNRLCYDNLEALETSFVAARTTKHLAFSKTTSGRMFTDALYVLTTNRWDLYAVVQSTLHEVWARKYSGALETRLRYSPTDCFENFAFPAGLWQTANPGLADIGERYHEHRKTLMLSLWLGLTDIYNLFHARDLSPALVAKVSKKPADEAERGHQGLIELRRLHRDLDIAIRDAYGWQDLDLGHDFHEVETLPENDRVRYTISPGARKEALRRLLALNHERAAAEAATLPTKAKKAVTRKPRRAVAPPDLFVRPDPASLPDGIWARPMQDQRAETGAMLAALLKAMAGPLPARQIRLAAVLGFEPRLLASHLTTQEAATWRRLVGSEADALPGGVTQFVARTGQAWGAAVRNLRGNGHLIEDIQAGTWAPGAGLDAFDTAGWPDGRARMVLDALTRVSPDEVVAALPHDLRGWIDAAAA